MSAGRWQLPFVPRAAALLALGLAGLGQPASADEPPPVDGAFRAAVAAAQARTVKIYGAAIGRTPGYASGVIVSPKGEIVTALGSHLSGGLLRVALPTGESHEAQVVRRSPELQLALLKIAAPTPEYFALDKSSVEAGDWIVAVSNAFKVAEGREALSVNLGVLSTRLRLDARRGYQDFPYDNDVYLYDAITSNPGAGGGAAVDVEGRLVGMIGRVIESKTTGTRLNYAVPADLLKQFVEGGAAPAAAPQPLAPDQPKTDLGVRLFGLGGRKSPAYVDRVLPGSLAAKAGVKADDLILSINGEAIRDAADFARLGASVPAGPVVIEVKRKNDVLQLRTP